MGRTLAQIALLATSNLASLRGRPGPPFAFAISVACGVVVFLATTTLAAGIERTLTATAHADRAVVVSSVSVAEATSFLQPHAVLAVRNREEFAIASPEVLLTLPHTRRDGEVARLSKRGVTPAAFQLRPEARIVAGRRFQPGKWEVIVGIRAAREFVGLAIGDTIRHPDAPNVDWTIVGHFSAGGGRHESELWVDKAALAAYGWEGESANVVWVALDARHRIANVADALRDAPMLANSRLASEQAFFGGFGEHVTAPLRTFAAVVGAVMALGAISAAVYAAASSVAARRREIATLRAVGMQQLPIAAAIVVESGVVAASGSLLGAAFAYVVFHNATVAGTLGLTGETLVYDRAVPVAANLVALASAIGAGLLGTIGAVAHAARLNVAAALRNAI